MAANQKRFMAQKGLDNNNNTIVNVSTPANASDAATKGYVDSSASSTLASANTYTDGKVSALVAAAPAALDTLNELATALGNDASFATTVTNSIATKLAVADFATTFDTRLGTKTTSNLTEGTNLYYTDARARAAHSAGTGISYNSTTGVIASTITQYTDALARAAVSVSGSLSYNSTTGVISYTTPSTSGITEGTNLYFTNARASAAAPVQSVAGRTGAVTLSVSDISGAASTTYVDTAITALVNGASASFDTLKEIQDAMATDAELSAAIAALTIGNGTQTVTAGSYLTGGGSFTANQTSNSSVTLSVDATSANTASKVVARDASGNFSAGTITANKLSLDSSPWFGSLMAGSGGTILSGSNSVVIKTNSDTVTAVVVAATGGISFGGYNNPGTSGQILKSNGDASPTWTSLTGGTGISVSGTTITNTGVTSLAGTANQVTVSASTGGVTLSLPQNIHTGATPTFSTITTTDVVKASNGFQTTAYVSNSRNRIWSFGNADGYGLSYFQGTAGRGSSDSIGFHFGTASDAASQFVMQSNGTFIATGELTAYSDAKVKTNVKTIENALDIVTKMRGVTFDRIQDGKASVGVIAQEVKEVLPQVVNYDEQADIHSVAYGNIVGVLIEAIKAQQVQIAELSAEVAKLKK